MPDVPVVLVIEDEKPIVRFLAASLRGQDYRVEVAETGAQALAMLAEHLPDLIILDLGLPDMDGIEVLDGIRGWSGIPILVLSARSTSEEKVRALEHGADDYVTKPFDMAELVARVRAATRRAQMRGETVADPIVTTSAFEIDRSSAKVTRGSEQVRLTPTEWHILDVLAANYGKLVTQRQLLADVWGPGYEGQGHYLRVHMAALRRKLEPEPGRPVHLLTEPGLGYRLV